MTEHVLTLVGGELVHRGDQHRQRRVVEVGRLDAQADRDGGRVPHQLERQLLPNADPEVAEDGRWVVR